GATLDELEIPDASDQVRGKHKDRHRDRPGRDGAPTRGERGPRPSNADTGFIFLNVGRKAGVRPGDLVGAIANQSGLTGRDIGPIRISEAYSVAGVPETSVDHVISSLANATIRGKRTNVRRYVQ